jgi:hypothetical protein
MKDVCLSLPFVAHRELFEIHFNGTEGFKPLYTQHQLTSGNWKNIVISSDGLPLNVQCKTLALSIASNLLPISNHDIELFVAIYWQPKLGDHRLIDEVVSTTSIDEHCYTLVLQIAQHT